MNISYKKLGQVMIPNLEVPKPPRHPIGIYGKLRRQFLKEYHYPQYSIMLIKGTLLDHLAEIDDICEREISQRTKAMAKAQGITEKLKKQDVWKWIGLMNNIRNCMREEVLKEYVYTER